MVCLFFRFLLLNLSRQCHNLKLRHEKLVTKVTSMGSGNNHLQVNKMQTRLLLALWDLAGTENQVTQGKLNKRVKGKKESVAVYEQIYQQLGQEDAIAFAKVKGTKYISLTEKGLQVLGAGLEDVDFRFDGTIVGSWTANALLKWMRQINAVDGVTSVSGNGKAKNAIASYEEFKQVALDVYDNLNKNYNLNNLVPIYRIRREIGKVISRENFNNWLLEMQADDIFQLEGGSVEDSAPDKIEDSVTTELDGLRCYASLIKYRSCDRKSSSASFF